MRRCDSHSDRGSREGGLPIAGLKYNLASAPTFCAGTHHPSYSVSKTCWCPVREQRNNFPNIVVSSTAFFLFLK